MTLSSFEAIVRALNAAGVPFLIVDGLAVNAHGYGRQTADVDLVIRLDPAVIANAFRALETVGHHPRVPVAATDLADGARRAQLATEKGMTVLGFHSDAHRETPIDIFVTEPFDFETEYARALVEEVAPGVPVRIVQLDTLLRLKRAAGRPQDLADIAELGLLHGDADG
jgi:predicted nucleotidyltransferase